MLALYTPVSSLFISQQLLRATGAVEHSVAIYALRVSNIQILESESFKNKTFLQ